jgi:DNA-directed RNA polymerase subunit N (RpoN/RPB10)
VSLAPFFADLIAAYPRKTFTVPNLSRLLLPLSLASLVACNQGLPPETGSNGAVQPSSAPAPPPTINPLDPLTCGETVAAKLVEYDRLMAAGEHWKAAGILRVCARNGTNEIKKRVESAEIASHRATINSPKASQKEKRQAMERLIADYPELGKQYERKVDSMESPEEKAERLREAARRKKQGVSLGMLPEEVVASSWGKPQRVNKTTTQRGTNEQWVYSGNNYLYFENGRLTAIQH